MDKIIQIISKDSKIEGLTQSELNNVEMLCKHPLPKTYKDFLLNMGKSAGSYMKGSSVFYDEIFILKEGAKELLEENNFKEIPENSFVFWMHQGYQMAFFNLDEGDNPPVYYFCEGENQVDFLKINSLLDFFYTQLEGYN